MDGLFPVKHTLYPGNTPDVKTAGEVLMNLREELHFCSSILVADRGVMSRGNIKEFIRAGIDIIWTIKQTPYIKSQINVDRDSFKPLNYKNCFYYNETRH